MCGKNTAVIIAVVLVAATAAAWCQVPPIASSKPSTGPATSSAPTSQASRQWLDLLAECEKAATDAEAVLKDLANSDRPAVKEACDGAWLAISAIRGLPRMHAENPGWKPPAAEFKNAIAYFLECAKAGRDPFAGMVAGVRPYRSPIDGDILRYEFSLPKDYNPSQKYPLEVSLHAYARQKLWRGMMYGLKPSANPSRCSDFRPHEGLDSTVSDQTKERPCIWMHIYGRGCSQAYTGMGEVAIMEALADIRKHYSIDESRIIIGGGSMGGTGGFRICTLYPDLFAAGYSITSGAAFWGPPQNGLYDASMRADNLCNTPFCVWDTPGDSHFKANRAFVDSLDVLAAKYPGGYPHLEVQDPAGSHCVIDAKLRDEGWAWLRKQVKNPCPRRVVYKSYGLRYHSAYWTHIDGMIDAEAPARIEAEALDGGKLRVATSNIERFHLDLTRELVGKVQDVEITVDGKVLRAAAGQTVNFALSDGAWGVSKSRYPAGLVKKPGTSGPMMDVFMGESVLFVYGTQKEKNPDKREKMVDAVVLSLFGKPDGRELFHTAFPRKADVDVTPADMAGSHLVLLGTPAENTLLARIAGSLPVQFAGDGVTMGGKTFKDAGIVMVYPNPLNPDRYVLLMPENYNSRLPDSRTYRDYFIGQFGTRTQAIEEGVFDSRWRLKLSLPKTSSAP